MHLLALGTAFLVGLAIIGIGAQYVVRPKAAMGSFGLPLIHVDPNVAWWLRLKGVRDIASGLVVLAVMALGGPRGVGIVLLMESLIPIGDMMLILAAKGSIKSALGIHGMTAMVMILAAISLMTGGA